MIVIDCSSIVDALSGVPGTDSLRSRLVDEELHASTLLDYEVVSVVRGLALGGHLTAQRADDLLAEAIATLYDGVTEVPQLIKAMRWNDLYQLFEDTTDKGEQVATVLSNISLKNA